MLDYMARKEALEQRQTQAPTADVGEHEYGDVPTVFDYDHWRHGGWYWFADGMRWPNGGCGCVSRQMMNPKTYKYDRKWRIVCDPRSGDHTYPNREAAAQAEWVLMWKAHRAVAIAQRVVDEGGSVLEAIQRFNRATPYRP